MISPRSAGAATAPEHIEAVTAERDFFRDKYAEQIDEMERLKDRLKESQRVIDRLRGEILELEAEKSGGAAGRGCSPQAPTGSPTAPKEASGGSTDTSVTCPTDDDERAENHAASAHGVPGVAVVGDGAGTEKTTKDGSEEDEGSISSKGEGREPGGDEDEDDEAENIRANAARMLLWANYQTSKRATPNTSLLEDSVHDDDSKAERRFSTPSKTGVSGAIVCSLPTSLARAALDDESSLGSGSRHRPERSVGSWRSGSHSRASHGKIGALFHNLRDMIDPPSESDAGDESEEE